MPNSTDGSIRLSVTGFAECFVALPDARAAKLRPFKFRNNGEGFGRSHYYKPCLAAVREYHMRGNDSQVFNRAIAEMRKQAESAETHLKRVKYEKNAEAIISYDTVYGKRRFRVLTNHRLAYPLGAVTLTAAPDLWLEEDGTAVLLKIGVSKKKREQVDVILSVIRKAAIASRYRVRAKNVVYLDISTGQELVCRKPLNYFNMHFRALARQITQIWGTLDAPVRAVDSAGQGGPMAHP